MQFSVLMAVYHNDNPDWVRRAVDSVFCQSVIPDQAVMVVDGPVSEECTAVLHSLCDRYPQFEIYPLEQNGGLGKALQYGLRFCRFEYVARMDSDDVCDPTRFEKQLKCFEADPTLSLIGSNMAEFTDSPEQIVGFKVVPESDAEIKRYAKSRCPFNHPSVFFKKSEVIRSGGYQHFPYHEDYFLWIRMILNGCKFYNIQENLVFFHIDNNTFERRGGKNYFKHEKALFRFMRENRLIGNFTYVKNILIRFVVQKLLPNSLRGLLYRKFLRKRG